MDYLMQIYQGTALEAFAAMSEADKEQVAAEYAAITATPGVTPGKQLADPTTATTVRVQDGKTLITDGPFAETKEALGGYFLLEGADLDAALELASRVPAARLGGAVEVRPLVERW